MERKPFKENTVLQNLSNGGAYLYSKREIPEGAQVFLAVRLSLAPDVESPAVMLAARGRVRRVEPKPDGRRGVAIAFERHRVL